MATPYFDLLGNAPNPFSNLFSQGLTPLEGLTSETLTGMAGAGGGIADQILPGLGIANFLLNPPQGPADATTVGSPTQGGKPIVSQVGSWGPTAMKGAMSGVMAGAPFGPPGMILGGLAGYGQGKK